MRRGLAAGLLAGAFAVVTGRLVRDALVGPKDRPSAGAHTYVLEREQHLPAPISEVFPFFADPQNLARITPESMRFRILHVEGLPMGVGTTIDYEIRPLRIPQRWRTLIVEYQPGLRFVDIQSRGPYRYWRHEHVFDEIAGGTRIRDRVEYQLPLGPLGRLAHAAAVSRQLRAIFDARHEAIAQIFGEG